MPNFPFGDEILLDKMKRTRLGRIYLCIAEIFVRYEVMHTAAAIAYYFTLSIFPFLMFLAALVGILHFPEDALIRMLKPLLSEVVAKTVLNYYLYLTNVSNAFSLVFGLLFSLYSASRAIHALTYSVNKVYHTHRVRSFLKSVIHSALFTIGMSVVLLLALFTVSAGSNLPQVFNVTLPRFGYAGYIYFVAVAAAFAVLTAFYCLAPVERVKLRYAVPGSLLCVLGLHVISFGVSIYVRISTRFSVLYGSIGAVIIVLLWLYFFAVCVLLGALVNRYAENGAIKRADDL